VPEPEYYIKEVRLRYGKPRSGT